MSWPLGKVSDIANVISGYAFKTEWFGSGEDKIIRIGNLQNGRVFNNEVATFDSATYKISDQYKIRPGDILMALSGATVGKIAIAQENDSGSYLNQRVAIVRGNSRENADYLKYVFSGQPLQKLLLLAGGAAQPNLSPKSLADMEIPIPPQSEQKRIATILDKADRLRCKSQQAIKLSDQFLRAVFLDMFGNPSKTANNRVKLGNVVLVDAPMVDPREDDYLDMLHIGPDRIEKNTGGLLPALAAREENLISKKFLFDERYVLYSKIRPYLRKCALAIGTGLCSADMYPIKPAEGMLTREFLWQLLLSDGFTRYTETLASRANIPKLNRDELAAFEFSLPSYKEQEKFSSIVKKLGYTNTLCVAAISSSNDTFNSLSQKAFAGEL